LIAFISAEPAFGDVKLFYNKWGQLTIEELASHYRIGKVDVAERKFKGHIDEYDLIGLKFLEIDYDSSGVKNGKFKYDRFGVVIEGVFENNFPKFSLPDSIMKQLVLKENFTQAMYIRKDDYKQIKDLLFPMPRSEDTVVINGQVFGVVEEMPTFPGGMSAVSKFLGYYLTYPEQAKEKKVSGKVLVEFIIMTDGTVNNVKVKEGIGMGCDEVAVFAISKLPDWKPGYQRGKAVPVKMVLPISFK
jgi:TonB family protein